MAIDGEVEHRAGVVLEVPHGGDVDPRLHAEPLQRAADQLQLVQRAAHRRHPGGERRAQVIDEGDARAGDFAEQAQAGTEVRQPRFEVPQQGAVPVEQTVVQRRALSRCEAGPLQ